MKLIWVGSAFWFLGTGSLCAQEYKVTTERSDSFSVAFVQLLNCAVKRFQDCKGDSLRYTWLGTDYRLTIPFPGSTMAIVRSRDWDQNAYVEFRGFASKKNRDQGIRDLVAKIKKALGNQLLDPYENKEEKEIYFYGLSVKDKHGYYSMNMELFGGRSSAPIYLLGPDREDERLLKEDFVLLKIYPGIPSYQYYIDPVIPPDEKLNITLRQFIHSAATDFDSMRMKKMDSLLKKRKGRDTIHINGFEAVMNYRGGNYSAEFIFPAATDTIAFKKQWLYYQQALQAALGTDYVYHLYASQGQPSIVYYSPGNKPRVYLDLEKSNNRLLIIIRIESSISHPTKRNMDLDDL